MLLPAEYHFARGRADLFRHPAFARIVVLNKRIRWIKDSKGSPSENHSWFVWDWRHKGPPHVVVPELD